MKKILYTVIILVLTVGCQKVFEPEIENVDPFLVVEGRITTEWGWQYIFLNKSVGYREYPYFDGVPGATVYIEDEEGNNTYFEDNGNGIYSYYFPFHNFINGEGYTTFGRFSFLPPGYGMLAYVFFLVTRNIELATMLLSSFSYILSVLLAYYVGTLIAGRSAGFLSAFFITFLQFFIFCEAFLLWITQYIIET